MTTFITYIELHSADRNDYLVLDNAMKKEAFTAGKTNAAAKQVEFKYHGALSIQHVINAVLRAAEKTGKRFSFTVMKDKNSKLLTANHSL